MDNEITINGIKYIQKLEPGAILDNTPENNWLYKENQKIWELNSLKVNEEKPWPQEGDEYFFINKFGQPTVDLYKEDGWEEKLKKFGNFFQTKEEAEMYSLRIESLSKAKFQAANIIGGNKVVFAYDFPTKEGCQEWYDKYGSSWLALLNDKK